MCVCVCLVKWMVAFKDNPIARIVCYTETQYGCLRRRKRLLVRCFWNISREDGSGVGRRVHFSPAHPVAISPAPRSLTAGSRCRSDFSHLRQHLGSVSDRTRRIFYCLTLFIYLFILRLDEFPSCAWKLFTLWFSELKWIFHFIIQCQVYCFNVYSSLSLCIHHVYYIVSCTLYKGLQTDIPLMSC